MSSEAARRAAERIVGETCEEVCPGTEEEVADIIDEEYDRTASSLSEIEQDKAARRERLACAALGGVMAGLIVRSPNAEGLIDNPAKTVLWVADALCAALDAGAGEKGGGGE